jgi:hypothetical protein
MKEEPLFLAKIKHAVYKIVLPIYLWSIGCKTLGEYLDEIERQFIINRAEGNVINE